MSSQQHIFGDAFLDGNGNNNTPTITTFDNAVLTLTGTVNVIDRYTGTGNNQANLLINGSPISGGTVTNPTLVTTTYSVLTSDVLLDVLVTNAFYEITLPLITATPMKVTLNFRGNLGASGNPNAYSVCLVSNVLDSFDNRFEPGFGAYVCVYNPGASITVQSYTGNSSSTSTNGWTILSSHGLLHSTDYKNNVSAASVGNHTLANLITGFVMDGVTLSNDMRFLLKNQTDQTENGIYMVNGVSTPVRAPDLYTDYVAGSHNVFVDFGTVNFNTSFKSTSGSGVVVGTDNLEYAAFSPVGQFAQVQIRDTVTQGFGICEMYYAPTNDGTLGVYNIDTLVNTHDVGLYNSVTTGDITIGSSTSSGQIKIGATATSMVWNNANLDIGATAPSASTHAVNKAYVDSIATGITWKQVVVAATTVAGTLATSFENGDTIDTITLVTGDRILIKNQASGIENGIYTVNTSGAPTRAIDLAAGSHAASIAVFSARGSVNADFAFICTNDAPTDVVGTDVLVFVQFGAGGGAAAGGSGDIQFNNAGVFDGDSNLTWDGTQLQVDKIEGILPATAIELYSDTTGNISLGSESGANKLILGSTNLEFVAPPQLTAATIADTVSLFTTSTGDISLGLESASNKVSLNHTNLEFTAPPKLTAGTIADTVSLFTTSTGDITIGLENGTNKVSLNHTNLEFTAPPKLTAGTLADTVSIFDTSTGTISIGGTSVNIGTTPMNWNNSNLDIGATAPSVSTHAANKAYVDSVANGISWKNSVEVSTTAPGTLASGFENGDTVDGIVLVTGYRILIKDQSSGIENGIYTVNVSGAPTRALDFATGASAGGSSVFIERGTVNADRAYVCTNDTGTDIVGTDVLVFTQFGAGASVAGSNTQVQFNNSGSFGASSSLVWTGTSLGINSIQGIAVTDSVNLFTNTTSGNINLGLESGTNEFIVNPTKTTFVAPPKLVGGTIADVVSLFDTTTGNITLGAACTGTISLGLESGTNKISLNPTILELTSPPQIKAGTVGDDVNLFTNTNTGNGNLFTGQTSGLITIGANSGTNATTIGSTILNTQAIVATGSIKSNVSLILRDSTTNTITIAAPSAVTTYPLTLPAAQGAASTVLTNNGSGVLTWTAPAVTAPGGSNTQIQFNNSGSFGGSASLAWDGTSVFVNSMKGVTATDAISLFSTSTTNTMGLFTGQTSGTITVGANNGSNKIIIRPTEVEFAAPPTLIAGTVTDTVSLFNTTTGGIFLGQSVDSSSIIQIGNSSMDSVTILSGTNIKLGTNSSFAGNITLGGTDGNSTLNLNTRKVTFGHTWVSTVTIESQTASHTISLFNTVTTTGSIKLGGAQTSGNLELQASGTTGSVDVKSALILSNKTTVTQATSITTAVTANTCAGVITTVSSTLASHATATFTVNCTRVLTGSVIQLTTQYSGSGMVMASVGSITNATSFTINLTNTTDTALDAVVKIHYTIL